MTIGLRLREERERLGFTQVEFAELTGTTKKSQIDYEKDTTQPRAGYLASIAAVGADIGYIVTGVRTVGVEMTSAQMKLLGDFGDASSYQRLLAEIVSLAANLERERG